MLQDDLWIETNSDLLEQDDKIMCSENKYFFDPYRAADACSVKTCTWWQTIIFDLT